VVGDSVEGNAHWYRISANTYIWAVPVQPPPSNITASPLENSIDLQRSLLWLTFTTAMK
jgi:hypothetical protein